MPVQSRLFASRRRPTLTQAPLQPCPRSMQWPTGTPPRFRDDVSTRLSNAINMRSHEKSTHRQLSQSHAYTYLRVRQRTMPTVCFQFFCEGYTHEGGGCLRTCTKIGRPKSSLLEGLQLAFETQRGHRSPDARSVQNSCTNPDTC